MSRDSFANGSGRSTTPFTTVKMAVVAPMLSASVRMAATESVGRARSARTAAVIVGSGLPMALPSLAHTRFVVVQDTQARRLEIVELASARRPDERRDGDSHDSKRQRYNDIKNAHRAPSSKA